MYFNFLLLAQLEEPFRYVPMELSDADLDQELEDLKATAELEREMRGGNDDEEEENEVRKEELFISQESQHLCGA